MHILIVVSYDGTNYCGWQKQNNSPTIQQQIEKALLAIYNREISVQGASRTDSGVHAVGQRVLFTLTEDDPKVPIAKIARVININLPKDIRIISAQEADDGFHPVYSAIKKTYEYRIYNSDIMNPMQRLYCGHIPKLLDFEKMRHASKYFIGTHDFKAFCATGGSAKTSERTIYSLFLEKQDDIITMSITGNGFLYNMVRIIAGTLIDVGLEKIQPDEIVQIIQSLDRSNAGKTAKAEGLILLDIYY